MATDSLNNRVYTKFQRHVDNAGDVVQAKDVNTVQSAVSENEKNIGKLYGADFVDKVMFSFDSNMYVNSLFADEVNEKKYVDFSLSKSILYNEKEGSLSIDANSITGDVYTTNIVSSLGGGSPLNDFFLITDAFIPVGSNVKHYIISENNEIYPIKAGEPKTPCHIINGMSNVRIKTVITKNAMGESPKLYGIALMFFDPAVEAEYGLVNPDLKRFDSVQAGLTTLIRDRAQEDKLVKVIEPTSTTELTYNEDGTLGQVFTVAPKDEVQTTEILNYGAYLNSANETDHVLLSILMNQVSTQALTNDISYKFFE